MSYDPTFLKKVQDALAELGSTLEKQNDEPNTAHVPAAGEPTQKRVMDLSDRIALRGELRKKSVQELHALFSLQSRRQDTGIPFDVWAATGGGATMTALDGNPTLRKALDTTGATALIRQDLEPILYELYVREFPAWERFGKEPANGLVHAYNQATSFGDAQFMSELGTVTDDTSVYQRATTPISVVATRRGVTLKSQFATLQGGAGFNPEQLELQGGLRAIAHKMQKTIFEGNSTTASGTTNDEYGTYDANGFQGLRWTLATSRAQNADPTASTPDSVRKFVNKAVIAAMQQGGSPSMAYLAPETKGQVDVQQDSNVMYVDKFTNVGVGVQTNSLNTANGPMPLFVVPGDAITTYTRSGVNVRDIYLLDESTISLPYLGSDGPTVLDIPIGISGQLTHLFIIFGMWGLAVKAPTFSNKVRVKVEA